MSADNIPIPDADAISQDEILDYIGRRQGCVPLRDILAQDVRFLRQLCEDYPDLVIQDC